MSTNLGTMSASLTADTGRFLAEMRKATQALQVFGKQVQNIAGQSQQGLASASSSFASFSRSLQTFGRGLTSLGIQIGLSISTPVATAFADAAKEAIEFESAFAGVLKTVEGAADDFGGEITAVGQRISDEFRAMSKILPESADKIAEIGEIAGQLGIRSDAIVKFTDTMIRLASVTRLSSEEAAQSLARLASIMQVNSDEFDNLGSAIVRLDRILPVNAEEITRMSLRIAGAGKQAGLTATDVLGLAAALSSVGVRAEAGGTSISRFIQKINLAVTQGTDDLQTLARVAGVTAEEFTQAFLKDPADAIQLFVDGLSQVKEEGGNTFSVLRELGLFERRLQDAVLRLAGAEGRLAESLREAAKAAAENLELTRASEIRFATTANVLTLFKNQLVDVAREFGVSFAQGIEFAVRSAGKLIPQLESLAARFNALPRGAKVAIGVIAGFTAAVGPALIAFGTFVAILGGASTAFIAGSALIKDMSIAAFALGTALLRLVAEIGFVVSAGLILGAAIRTVTDNFGFLRAVLATGVIGIFGLVIQATDKLLGALQALFSFVPGSDIDEGIAIVRDNLKPILEDTARIVEEGGKDIRAKAEQGLVGFGEAFQKNLDDAATVFGPSLEAMQNKLGQGFDNLIAFSIRKGDELAEALTPEPNLGEIESAFGRIGVALEGEAQDLGARLVEALKPPDAGQAFAPALIEAQRQAQEILKRMGVDLSADAETVGTQFLAGITRAKIPALGPLTVGLKNALKTLGVEVTAESEVIGQKIIDALSIPEAEQKKTPALTFLIQNLKETLSSAGVDVETSAKQIGDAIKEIFAGNISTDAIATMEDVDGTRESVEKLAKEVFAFKDKSGKIIIATDDSALVKTGDAVKALQNEVEKGATFEVKTNAGETLKILKETGEVVEKIRTLAAKVQETPAAIKIDTTQLESVEQRIQRLDALTPETTFTVSVQDQGLGTMEERIKRLDALEPTVEIKTKIDQNFEVIKQEIEALDIPPKVISLKADTAGFLAQIGGVPANLGSREISVTPNVQTGAIPDPIAVRNVSLVTDVNPLLEFIEKNLPEPIATRTVTIHEKVVRTEQSETPKPITVPVQATGSPTEPFSNYWLTTVPRVVASGMLTAQTVAEVGVVVPVKTNTVPATEGVRTFTNASLSGFTAVNDKAKRFSEITEEARDLMKAFGEQVEDSLDAAKFTGPTAELDKLLAKLAQLRDAGQLSPGGFVEAQTKAQQTFAPVLGAQVDAVFKNLQQQFQNIDVVTAAFSTSVTSAGLQQEILTQKIQAGKSAIQQLISQGYDPQSAAVQRIIRETQGFQAQLDAIPPNFEAATAAAERNAAAQGTFVNAASRAAIAAGAAADAVDQFGRALGEAGFGSLLGPAGTNIQVTGDVATDADIRAKIDDAMQSFTQALNDGNVELARSIQAQVAAFENQFRDASQIFGFQTDAAGVMERALRTIFTNLASEGISGFGATSPALSEQQRLNQAMLSFMQQQIDLQNMTLEEQRRTTAAASSTADATGDLATKLTTEGLVSGISRWQRRTTGTPTGTIR